MHNTLLWRKIIINSKKKNVRNHQSLLKWGGSALVVVVFSGLDFIWDWNVDCEREVTYWNDVGGNQDDERNPQKQIKKKNGSFCCLKHDLCCDVCIIGGGMAGLHTALALKELSNNNKRVIVMEASREIGLSASGMSKGLVVSGVQVPNENIKPPEFASMIDQWTDQAFHRLINDIIGKYNIPCHLEKGGGLLEASIHSQYDNNDNSNDGNDDDILSADQVVDKLGSKPGLYKSGEYDDECVGIDPLALTRGLAQVCQSKGVLIYTQTKATSVITDATTNPKTNNDIIKGSQEKEKIFTVITAEGAKVCCKDVVICTGANQITPKLSPQIAYATVPVRTWMAVTQPLGKDCPIPLNDDKVSSMMAGDDYVSLNYWRRTVDGRLLFGSLAYTYPVPRCFAEWRLKSALLQIYPQLSSKNNDLKFDRVWSGSLSFSRRALPLIGKDTTNGVWYATAFAGHGIVPTTMAGNILANAILKKDDSSWRMFEHYNYGPKYCFYPFSRMTVQALLLLYNIVDWLHVNTNLPVPQLPRPW